MTAPVILDILPQNIDTAKRLIKVAVGRISERRECGCASALKDAIVSGDDHIPPQIKQKSARLTGKYSS